MSLDLQIENFHLTLWNAAGHEHRVASIAERAMALLAERADERWRSTQEGAPHSRPHVQSTNVNLDLNSTGDEQAASLIADACLESLSLQL